jgi:putative membrane protein
VKKLKVKPQDNPTSRTLVQQAEAKRKELSKLKGADFDKAYAQNEVAYHQQVNDAVQNTLIPSAENRNSGKIGGGSSVFASPKRLPLIP